MTSIAFSKLLSLKLARDPRFLDFAGKYSEEKFKQGFSFLSEVHISELNVLRENIKRARKMVLSSPRDQRSEWEAEVARLERALKRSESVVNRDKSEKVDRDALNKIAQDEKEKRAQGKGRWFMKDGIYLFVLFCLPATDKSNSCKESGPRSSTLRCTCLIRWQRSSEKGHHQEAEEDRSKRKEIEAIHAFERRSDGQETFDRAR